MDDNDLLEDIKKNLEESPEIFSSLNQLEEEEILYPKEEDLEYPEEPFEDFHLELEYFDPEKQEDILWQEKTGLNEDTLCGAIETLVFMSERPMSLSKIKSHIDEEIPLRVLHSAISRLQKEYEEKHHGIRLLEVAEGFQFRTKATYARYVQDLFKVTSLELTPSALEVLAILAYRQPISKMEVEKIRGVDSSHLIRGLIDKKLVRIVGRSEDVGRPVLYGTSPEFLEVFNLPNLEALPPEHELQELSKSSIGKISDIKTLVHTGDKNFFVYDEIEELDILGQSIKEVGVETHFLESLRLEDKKKQDGKAEDALSAFDLLETFIQRDQIVKENKKAAESQLFAIGEDFPTIISDLNNGPFNTPDLEDDDFEMIDLDTNLPIENEGLEEVSQELLLKQAFDQELEEMEFDEEDLDQKLENIDQSMKLLLDKASEFDIDITS